jgi:hypothetical protein
MSKLEKDYFLFYFFEISEIFPYKTPDLEYVNFATPYTMHLLTYIPIYYFFLFDMWNVEDLEKNVEKLA